MPGNLMFPSRLSRLILAIMLAVGATVGAQAVLAPPASAASTWGSPFWFQAGGCGVERRRTTRGIAQFQISRTRRNSPPGVASAGFALRVGGDNGGIYRQRFWDSPSGTYLSYTWPPTANTFRQPMTVECAIYTPNYWDKVEQTINIWP